MGEHHATNHTITDANKNRRSGIVLMGRLIGLVLPLFHFMTAAVLLGVLGYLCAIFLTILAGYELTQAVFREQAAWLALAALIGMAVLRGVLHYAEQYFNHFIAFRLLAMLRHRVFDRLRKLCPAKLEGRDKGNLISIITTDIELLEVFYAHTISPIIIGILTSGVMVVFLGQYHYLAGLLALAAYVLVGAVVPIWHGKKGAGKGMEFREGFGDLNSYVLDSLRGLEETIQYGQGEVRMEEMKQRSDKLARMQKKLSRLEASQRSVTNGLILLCSVGMLLLMLTLQGQGEVDRTAVLISTIAMMGSFGPVVALSNLSNNLHQTLASAERVLSLMEEEPKVEEVVEGKEISGKDFRGMKVEHVTFGYEEEVILNDCSMKLEPGKITGIHGSSGCGKSTLLKLLMRFWDVESGTIEISGEKIQNIRTGSLREIQSYVTQETYLFQDSIAGNIAIGKPGASMEEIQEAAKKASIHEFIMGLPRGYETEVGELGDTLSGGERQRIGIARAFLHDGPCLLLDEPTSNLDSLNEGVILKALKEAAKDKTILLVSHRASTMGIAENVFHMKKYQNSFVFPEKS